MKDSIAKLPSNQEEALDTCDQEQREKEKQRTLNKILIAYLASAFKSHIDLTISDCFMFLFQTIEETEVFKTTDIFFPNIKFGPS
jgi:hypothetical protein